MRSGEKPRAGEDIMITYDYKGDELAINLRQCPKCGSVEGERCVGVDGTPHPYPHLARNFIEHEDVYDVLEPLGYTIDEISNATDVVDLDTDGYGYILHDIIEKMDDWRKAGL